MRLLIRSIIMTWFYVLAFACFGSAQTVEIVDGVRIVHNDRPRWESDPPIHLEFIRQIGEYEGVGKIELFQPVDVVCDSVGNMYVVEMGNHRILKLDKKGKLLKTFGRWGQGPGEFAYFPRWLCIDSNGYLYVMDGGLSPYSPFLVFNNEGKEVKRYRFDRREQTLFYNTDLFLMNNFNEFIQHLQIATKGTRSSEGERPGPDGVFGPEYYTVSYFRFYDTMGFYIREFQVKPFEIHDNNLNANGWMNSIFYALDDDSNIYVSFQFQNRIEKYSRFGELLLHVDRKKDFKQSTDFPIIKIGRKSQTRFNIFSAGIGIDHKERIWVASIARQLTNEEYLSNKEVHDILQFEVYSKEGELLCIIPCGYYVFDHGQAIITRIYGDRLFILDKLTRMVIYEYKIVG
ncbi:6-bladed beta-propeller [candidate division KSB1 bacterium]